METLDHPSDASLFALGRKFFKADDECILNHIAERGLPTTQIAVKFFYVPRPGATHSYRFAGTSITGMIPTKAHQVCIVWR